MEHPETDSEHNVNIEEDNLNYDDENYFINFLEIANQNAIPNAINLVNTTPAVGATTSNPNSILNANNNNNNNVNSTANANKAKRHSKFNKNFLTLRNNLKMEKVSRKSQFDSILKKSKAKVFRTIHDSIKKCLINSYRLLRLPQNFITNIKIDFNKEYLKKTIIEIYTEYEIINDVEELFEKNFVKEEKKSVFRDFLELSFRDIFEYYITSKQYVRDREKIKKKEGEKFSILFAFIAQNFIEYYTQSKGNQPKKHKVKKGGNKYVNKNENFVNLGVPLLVHPVIVNNASNSNCNSFNKKKIANIEIIVNNSNNNSSNSNLLNNNENNFKNNVNNNANNNANNENSNLNPNFSSSNNTNKSDPSQNKKRFFKID